MLHYWVLNWWQTRFPVQDLCSYSLLPVSKVLAFHIRHHHSLVSDSIWKLRIRLARWRRNAFFPAQATNLYFTLSSLSSTRLCLHM
jgi:hypothetical protein